MGTGEVRGESGEATVLALAVIAALLTLTVGGLSVLGALRTVHLARSSADLAALAAADHLQVHGDASAACAEARRIARRQAARVRACAVHPGEVVAVTTTVAIPLRLPGVPKTAQGRARAGPAPTGGGEGR